jgi:hypothetical protein
MDLGGQPVKLGEIPAAGGSRISGRISPNRETWGKAVVG